MIEITLVLRSADTCLPIRGIKISFLASGSSRGGRSDRRRYCVCRDVINRIPLIALALLAPSSTG